MPIAPCTITDLAIVLDIDHHMPTIEFPSWLLTRDALLPVLLLRTRLMVLFN